MLPIILAGFGTGMGLIAAIGAQNVFVLTKGMDRQHLLLVPLVCFLCDVLLMTLGIAGVGSLIAMNDNLLNLAAGAGAVFLASYGLRSLLSAFKDGSLSRDKADASTTLKTLLATLAVTLLNPHVYLDCLVVMGGIGSRYPLPDRWYFLSGVLCASFFWFFGLSFFGRTLAPFLSRPRTWKVMHILIWVVLWIQAAGLARFVIVRMIEAA